MKIIYLSHFISENTPVYGGAIGTIKFDVEKSILNGDTSNNMKLSFPSHIGSHIDFPFHFSMSGKKGNDYPAEYWVFRNVGFLDCEINEVEEQLDNLSSDIEILILKTGFGANRNKKEYWERQPIIPSSFASLFKSKFPKLRIFGFDLISLTSKLDRQEGKLAHIEFLLKNDILVLEDLKLNELNSTPLKIIVTPLQIESADGVPCTILAFI